MVKIPESVYITTCDYIKKLKKQIPVEKAFLFGSYAKGSNTQFSDIDIAIFSPYFENISRIDGLTFLLTIASDFNADIQPQPYSLNDYAHPSGIVNEIINNGIEIKT